MSEHIEGCEIVEGIKFYKVTQQGAELKYERNWLVEDLLLSNGAGMLTAGSKVGKTSFCCELAISISRGVPFLGKYQTQKGKVMMWLCEDLEEDVKVTMQEICLYHGVEQSQLGIIWGDSMEGLCLEKEEDQKRLIGIINYYKPSLLVLDSFSSFYGGPENTASEVKKATRLGLLRIVRNTRTAILVTHHEKTNCGTKRGGKRMRGSGELHAWGDHYMFLERTRQGCNLFYTDQRTANITPHTIRLDSPQGKTGPKGLVADEIQGEIQKDEHLEIKIQTLLNASPGVHHSISLVQERLKGRWSPIESALEKLFKAGIIERIGKPRRHLYFVRLKKESSRTSKTYVSSVRGESTPEPQKPKTI